MTTERAAGGNLEQHVGRLVEFYRGIEYRVLGAGPVTGPRGAAEREVQIQTITEGQPPGGGDTVPAGTIRTISVMADDEFPVRDDPTQQ